MRDARRAFFSAAAWPTAPPHSCPAGFHSKGTSRAGSLLPHTNPMPSEALCHFSTRPYPPPPLFTTRPSSPPALFTTRPSSPPRPHPPTPAAGFRVANICIGVVIDWAITILLVPVTTPALIRQQAATAMQRLGRLCAAVVEQASRAAAGEGVRPVHVPSPKQACLPAFICACTSTSHLAALLAYR